VTNYTEHPNNITGTFEALTVGWENPEPHPITGQPATIPALLPALRDAIFGGMEKTGGSSFGSRMPIDTGAADLFQQIDEEIAEAWGQAFPNQIPTTERTEALLSAFYAVTRANPTGELITITVKTQKVANLDTLDETWWVETSKEQHTPQSLMKRWMKLILDFFEPPRRREIMHPCVECGKEWLWKHENGETKPYRVFVFEHDMHGNTIRACCLVCGASWGMQDMKELASKMIISRRTAQEKVLV